MMRGNIESKEPVSITRMVKSTYNEKNMTQNYMQLYGNEYASVY